MDYTTLYVQYNDELRPLISEFEGREEQFEEPILKSMAYVVDELSLCVQEENADEQKKHYVIAQKNLEEAVINSYKYLVYSHHKRLKKFNRRFTRRQLELFDNGRFIGKFSADLNRAKNCTRRARKQKALENAKDDFKQAYVIYSDLEHKMSNFESEGAALQPRTTSVVWTIVKMLLSIIISVGVAYFFSKCTL
ncbi:MAG: hypothetical protein IJK85_00450 [Bacteroidales bacterium]|nr:hypothetical protein [Bacteroidales bacterium]